MNILIQERQALQEVQDLVKLQDQIQDPMVRECIKSCIKSAQKVLDLIDDKIEVIRAMPTIAKL